MLGLLIVVALIVALFHPALGLPFAAGVLAGVVLALLLAGQLVAAGAMAIADAVADDESPKRGKFAPAPAAASEAVGAWGAYRGAVGDDDYPADRRVGDNARAPAGNPFNRSRTALDYGEVKGLDSSDAVDADEAAAYEGLARNDAARQTEGALNLRRDMDKYYRQELEKEEDARWWGRHEL